MSFKRLPVFEEAPRGPLGDKLAANYLSWLCHQPQTHKQSPKGKQLPAKSSTSFNKNCQPMSWVSGLLTHLQQ